MTGPVRPRGDALHSARQLEGLHLGSFDHTVTVVVGELDDETGSGLRRRDRFEDGVVDVLDEKVEHDDVDQYVGCRLGEDPLAVRAGCTS